MRNCRIHFHKLNLTIPPVRQDLCKACDLYTPPISKCYTIARTNKVSSSDEYPKDFTIKHVEAVSESSTLSTLKPGQTRNSTLTPQSHERVKHTQKNSQKLSLGQESPTDIKDMQFKLMDLLSSNSPDFRLIFLTIMPLLSSKNVIQALISATLMLENKNFKIAYFQFLLPKKPCNYSVESPEVDSASFTKNVDQPHTNLNLKPNSSSNYKSIESDLMLLELANYRFPNLKNDSSSKTQIEIIKFNISVLLSVFFFTDSLKNFYSANPLSFENAPTISILLHFVRANRLIEKSENIYSKLNGLRSFSASNVTSNFDVQLSRLKQLSDLYRTIFRLNSGPWAYFDINTLVEFVLRSISLGLSPSGYLFNRLAKAAIFSKKTEQIFFLYANDLNPVGFTKLELEALSEFRDAGFLENKRIHMDIMLSYLDSQDILKATTVARLINHQFSWTWVLNLYISNYGLDEKILEIVDYMIKDLKHKNSASLIYSNLCSSDSSTPNVGDFHYTVISVLLKYAYDHCTKKPQRNAISQKTQGNSVPKLDPTSSENLVKHACLIHFKLIPYLTKPPKHAIDMLIWALIRISNDTQRAAQIYKDILERFESVGKSFDMSYIYSGLAYGYSVSNNFNQLVALTQQMESHDTTASTVYYDILIRTLLYPKQTPNLTETGTSFKNDSKAPNVRPNNNCISGALALFAKMKADHLPRSGHTYLALMRALARHRYPQKVYSLFVTLFNEERYWARARKQFISELRNTNIKSSSTPIINLAAIPETKKAIKLDPFHEFIKSNNYIYRNSSFFSSGPEADEISELLKFQPDKAIRSKLRDFKVSLSSRATIRAYVILMHAYKRSNMHEKVIRVWGLATRYFFKNCITKPGTQNQGFDAATNSNLEKLRTDLNHIIALWGKMASMAIKSSIYLNKPKQGISLLLDYQDVKNRLEAFAELAKIFVDLKPDPTLTDATTWLYLENQTIFEALAFIQKNSPALFAIISDLPSFSKFLHINQTKNQYTDTVPSNFGPIFGTKKHRVFSRYRPNMHNHTTFKKIPDISTNINTSLATREREETQDFLGTNSKSVDVASAENGIATKTLYTPTDGSAVLESERLEISKHKKGLTQLVRFFTKFGYLSESTGLTKFLFEKNCPPNSSVWRTLMHKLSEKVSRHVYPSSDFIQAYGSFAELTSLRKPATNRAFYSSGKPSYADLPKSPDHEKSNVISADSKFLRLCKDLASIYECWRANEGKAFDNINEASTEYLQQSSKTLNSDYEACLVKQSRFSGSNKGFTLSQEPLSADPKFRAGYSVPETSRHTKQANSAPNTIIGNKGSILFILQNIISIELEREVVEPGYYILPSKVMKNIAIAYLYLDSHYSVVAIYLLNAKVKYVEKYKLVQDSSTSEVYFSDSNYQIVQSDLSDEKTHNQGQLRSQRNSTNREPSHDDITHVIEGLDQLILYFIAKSEAQKLQKTNLSELATDARKEIADWNGSNLDHIDPDQEKLLFERAWSWMASNEWHT